VEVKILVGQEGQEDQEALVVNLEAEEYRYLVEEEFLQEVLVEMEHLGVMVVNLVVEEFLLEALEVMEHLVVKVASLVEEEVKVVVLEEGVGYFLKGL